MCLCACEGHEGPGTDNLGCPSSGAVQPSAPQHKMSHQLGPYHEGWVGSETSLPGPGITVYVTMPDNFLCLVQTSSWLCSSPLPT